ncbi:MULTISPECIES: bifunctional cobalt-precorrin-7 (C(5))-methyltransferase/cobalt-precorrin-6B (C(15))-methyltransferase [Pseudomonas]|uniref:Precorrin-6Y C5,15-methyltransferase n=2 Tax=Pseudomonadaceae TaxID=135621 RepID=A0A0D0IYN3_9PSED|nr:MULTISPECIES: bifunctional cobalt-precorrin-7 (C(5))-methyltransferase/cobalt-precorrin-6B (C(15))-methyltransferase [Pseudomonas]KIP98322.1 precorrin-6Y C5,15-methyltransferase [Pseudomonas fulva]MCW2295166.1 precorrin-6Y C5,15-methyltransferase (decarboxylating) [Pseudomonas sp. BIGb0408]NYH75560.1 precorrin-6Y C5,15-methyltransferase (decarboxylating) [Pseudomonas flavescens]
MTPWLTVVGIGEDGYPGLGKAARHALLAAEQVFGSERQLALLPHCIRATRLPWPKPFSLAPVLERRGTPVCVLASGDPMFFGVGASLARELPSEELHILPAPSSCSLAAARLGWPLQSTPLVSLVGRPLAALNTQIHPGVRLLVLSNDGESPAAIAGLLRERGFGPSRLSVFEHLGGERERRIDGLADGWSLARSADLNLVAIDCVAGDDAMRLPLTPGLPDDAYRHDGQLTKRDVRAITLARLAPLPGELLWDVGAGCGSIGIEWLRTHPACRAIAIEADEGRQGHIAHNRDALGVPGLQLVAGRAPEALAGLAAPDAIFIGGGVTAPGVLQSCWRALKPGGRLVANAVTLQSEAALIAFRGEKGGELTRIEVAQARPLGGFDTWRAALPITLLQVSKPL